MATITVTATESVPRDQVAAVERHIASLARSAGEELTGIQLTLRHDPDPGSQRPFVADVIAFHAGGVLAAHATGATPVEAGEVVAERLRQSLGATA